MVKGQYSEKARQIAFEVAKIAEQTGTISIFAIENTAGDDGKGVFFPPLRFAPGAVSGVVKIRAAQQAEHITNAVDGIVEIILIDVEKKVRDIGDIETVVKGKAKKSRVLTAKLNDMTVESADAVIAQTAGTLQNKRVAIIGAGNIGSKLALKLAERGAVVVFTRRDGEKAKKIAEALGIIKNKWVVSEIRGTDNNLEASREADVLISFSPKTPSVTVEMVDAMKPDGLLIDGGIGTIYPDAIKRAVERGIKVFRLDMRAGFSGGITTILETENLIKNVMGKKIILGVPVVAGGLIGEAGDVIVDNITHPTRVIGIGDGKGGLIKDPMPEYKKRMETVIENINGVQK